MKLLRWGPAGAERPGLLDAQGTVRDLSAVIADLEPSTVTLESLDRLRALDPARLPAVEGSPRLGPPLARVPNFHAIGLNYRKHAAESGVEPPAEPVVFSKATSSLSGPNDPVMIPRGSEKTDWEVELGVVIGKGGSYIAESEALGHVAGYCTVNDVSERSYQLEGTGQWIKGKSAPTFGPLGPWLVTADEIGDPQALGLWLDLNGERKQDGHTSDMIFTVAHIVSYLSRFFRLLPGDVVTTGTPHGVGMGLKPPRYLEPGDRLHLGVERLGEQTQDVVAYSE